MLSYCGHCGKVIVGQIRDAEGMVIPGDGELKISCAECAKLRIKLNLNKAKKYGQKPRR